MRRHTFCQGWFTNAYKTHKSWYGWTEYVKIEDSDAQRRVCLLILLQREGKCEIYYEGQVKWDTNRIELVELATVLFPTPPFPLATATTFSTFTMDRFSIGPPLLGI